MVINLGKIVPTILSEVNENSDDLINSRGIAAALAKKLTVVDGVATADVRFEGALEFASGYGSSMVSRKGYYIQAMQVVDSSTMLLTLGETPRTSEEINNSGIAQTFDSNFESGFEDHIDSYVCMDVGRYCPDCARILSVDGNKLTVRPTYTFWNDDSESPNYPFFSTTGKFSVSLSAPESLDVNLNYLNSVNSVGIDLDTTAWSFGERAHSLGPGSVTVGINCVTTGAGSTTLGEGLYNPFNGCLMIGKYPIRYYSPGGYDPIFVVGDGTPGSRHSAFVIRKGMMEINIDPARIYLENTTLAKYVSDVASGGSSIDPMDKDISQATVTCKVFSGSYSDLAADKHIFYKMTVPTDYGPFMASKNDNFGLMFMQNLSNGERGFGNREMRSSNGFEVVYNPDCDEYMFSSSSGMFIGKLAPGKTTIAWGTYSSTRDKYGVISTGTYNGKTVLMCGRAVSIKGETAKGISSVVEGSTLSIGYYSVWYGNQAADWCDPSKSKSTIIGSTMVACKLGGGLEFSQNILQKVTEDKTTNGVTWEDCSVPAADAAGNYNHLVTGKDKNGDDVVLAVPNDGATRVLVSTDGSMYHLANAPTGPRYREPVFTKNGGVVLASDSGVYYTAGLDGTNTVWEHVIESGNWFAPTKCTIDGVDYWITTSTVSGYPKFSYDGKTWIDLFKISGAFLPPVVWNGKLYFPTHDGVSKIKTVELSDVEVEMGLKRAMYTLDTPLPKDASTEDVISMVNDIRNAVKDLITKFYK